MILTFVAAVLKELDRIASQQPGSLPPRGQEWGNTFEIGVPSRGVAREKWICLEVMVKMNDIGDSNGEQAYWLDGKLSRTEDGRITSYLGKGFPSVGTWAYDKFKPYAAGEGVAWTISRERRSHRGRQAVSRLRLEKHAQTQHQRHLALPLHVSTGKRNEQGLVGPRGGGQEIHRPPGAPEPVGQIIAGGRVDRRNRIHFNRLAMAATSPAQ